VEDGAGGCNLTYDKILATIMGVSRGDVDEDSTDSETMVRVTMRLLK